ncbi:MAG: LytR/AlgR family response regulator transcription factor [Luteibaculaceae bacterium]
MRCVVIEDDGVALKVIEHCISKTPFLEQVRTFTCVEDFAKSFHENYTDLIFLDIELPGANGIEFLQEREKKGLSCPQVILCTSKKQFAIEAFNLEVLDYLVKPYTYERFLKAATRAYSNYKAEQSSEKEDVQNFLVVKSTGISHKVYFDDILYIEAQGDYMKIIEENGKILTHGTLKEFEEKLPNFFKRVHRSFLVNQKLIDLFGKDFIRINDVKIPVSRTYKPIIQEILKNNTAR